MKRAVRQKSPQRPYSARVFGGISAAQRLIEILQQTTVLVLAVLGFLFCLITSYQLTVFNLRAVWTAIFYAALFSAVFSSKRRGILVAVLLAAAGFVIWRFSDSLLQGLLLLLDHSLTLVELHLPDVLKSLLLTHDAKETATLMTMGLQALLFFATLLSSYFVIVRPSVFGLAFATLPLLIPASFFSLSPGVVPFFCLFAAYLMLCVLNSIGRLPSPATRAELKTIPPRQRSELSAQRSAQQLLSLFALPLILLATLLSSIILPQKGYERPEAIETLQQKIFSMDFGDLILKSNDGLTHGSLRNLSDIRFTGKIAIKLQVSEQQPFFLRDFSGAVYTSAGWQSVSNSVYEKSAETFQSIAPQNLFAAATAASEVQNEPYTLSIQNVSGISSSIWTPNGLVTTADEIDGAAYVQDTALGYAKSQNDASYTLEALPYNAIISSVPLTSEATLRSAYLAAAGSAMGLGSAEGEAAQQVQSAAQAYIDYVFEAYTALPEETLAAAQRLCETYGLSVSVEGGSVDLFQTCQALYTLLSERCSYDYAPEQIPADEDFTTYFLEVSRSGYCVHFATAATVLLRALGIPARYAEGYIVIDTDYDKVPDENGYIDIEDTHAHAWVEVFDPVQLEWIPMEMTASTNRTAVNTPDSGDEDSGEAQSATAEPTATPTPEPTPEPTAEPTSEPAETSSGATESPSASPSAESESSTAQPEASPTPGAGDESDSGDEGEGDGASNSAEDSSGPLLWPLLVILLAAVPPLVAFGWRKFAQDRLRKRFFQRDTTAAVLAIAQSAMDLLRFAGCAPMLATQLAEDYVPEVKARLPWIDHNRLYNLLDSAQRARFSGKVSSKQERAETLAFMRVLSAGIRSRLPRFRRWLFYWRFPPV
ncbi:MAG: transglutaminase-like domain-containing protein [Clostridiaceae bacterium]